MKMWLKSVALSYLALLWSRSLLTKQRSAPYIVNFIFVKAVNVRFYLYIVCVIWFQSIHCMHRRHIIMSKSTILSKLLFFSRFPITNVILQDVTISRSRRLPLNNHCSFFWTRFNSYVDWCRGN